LREYLKKPITPKNIDCTEELESLYYLTGQHTFLYEGRKNSVYKDNLNELLIYINSDEKLCFLKPYIIFAVLSRKHGMMQNRENYFPNIKAVFDYQKYNVFSDNGKNFKTYQSYLELYDHLRRNYIDDDNIDMGLCDFCFANLSSLSEWYYLHCEPNEDIPMTLCRKIITVMPESFPMILSYEEYNTFNDDELQLYADAENKLTQQMLDTSLKFIEI
jgi:hypothetical protein